VAAVVEAYIRWQLDPGPVNALLRLLDDHLICRVGGNAVLLRALTSEVHYGLDPTV
jgi:hypothetical protein